jgi:hypothetical protein
MMMSFLPICRCAFLFEFGVLLVSGIQEWQDPRSKPGEPETRVLVLSLQLTVSLGLGVGLGQKIKNCFAKVQCTKLDYVIIHTYIRIMVSCGMRVC